ncbi:enolase C-terminal domain-like protein [Arthrobacter sp. EH-1B-1]|uniref:Enolase C-terminal domain-like protein n=1 Tax=Arthrobacter vasquezii TaxID=2977629 RepID=A0ABT6CU72_9MICC|nr:enolase C-terminal domain-like protein [Arthrobacter vasquezii]MDF9277615.1 enolase C-terminal domain-like protein [Arthrobacter vasquezii]
MRIVESRELTVHLIGGGTNAVVDFSHHTVSLVALISDVIRGGRPVTGVAFNSIGRFGQAGILRERMFPRLHAAEPDSLLTEGQFDPAKILAAVLANEKPGGHGDRASAAASIELAAWDLRSKLSGRPAWDEIARYHGHQEPAQTVPVYAAGGYYYDRAQHSLTDELKSYADQGYSAFKIKIGGASLSTDLGRIERALTVAGNGDNLAVDANGRFDQSTALQYAHALEPYGLRWFEEPGDPLDFELHRIIGENYGKPLATGENLFSSSDVRNLVRYGAPRSADIFQMDAGLSYGLTEYREMLKVVQGHGVRNTQIHPHGGHLINLHIVGGLGLGGCEVYPGVFQPFGGYPHTCSVDDGTVRLPEQPGFCLETKPELTEPIRQLLS